MTIVQIIQFLIIQVIVFGTLIYFLRKILYGDTQSAINRLDHVYQDMLKKQKDLSQKIEEAEKEYNEKKEEGTQIAQKLKNEAMEEAQKKEEEILKSARAEAQEIIEKAYSTAKKTQLEVEKALRAKLVDEAVALIGKGFNEQVEQAIHQELVRQFLARGNEFNLSEASADLDKINVKTAFKLEPTVIKQLEKLCSDKSGHSITIEEEVDTSLVAGIVVHFGTLLLDGSMTNFIKEAATEKKIDIERE